MKGLRWLKGFGIPGLFLILSGQIACAHGMGRLQEGTSANEVVLADLVARIPLGSVVVVGENHGVELHQRQQLALLDALRQAGHRVSVGMEFLSYPVQGALERYRSGALSEADFLREAQWGGTPFDFYREQILFPSSADGGTTVALNAPRALTSRVARVGVEGLSTEERALMPPDFTLGRASYRRRFAEQMPHLPDPSALDRYFAAQSVWDETMAWRFVEWRRANAASTFVIIVGEFHVRYGGGLPDRLLARSGERAFTISQAQVRALGADEQRAELEPHATDGARADWIWTDLDPSN